MKLNKILAVCLLITAVSMTGCSNKTNVDIDKQNNSITITAEKKQPVGTMKINTIDEYDNLTPQYDDLADYKKEKNLNNIMRDTRYVYKEKIDDYFYTVVEAKVISQDNMQPEGAMVLSYDGLTGEVGPIWSDTQKRTYYEKSPSFGTMIEICYFPHMNAFFLKKQADEYLKNNIGFGSAGEIIFKGADTKPKVPMSVQQKALDEMNKLV